MATLLYLDTARFGRMRLLAQEAERDFARLCGEEGGSVVIEELLRSGVDSWPEAMRRRYPGLAHWPGLGGLEQSARSLLGTLEEPEVLLAGRSGTLMQLAARALFSHCRRILHTDLEWPSYTAVLREEGSRAGGRVWCVSIEDLILDEQLGEEEVIDLIAAEYRRLGCDGLFLSAVSYRGVRFPAEGLLDALAGPGSPRFTVIDAAQALGHMRCKVRGGDMVLGGMHKWLRSGHPLGLAYAFSTRAKEAVSEVVNEGGASSRPGDPLYSLVRQLAGRRDRASGRDGRPLRTFLRGGRRFGGGPRAAGPRESIRGAVGELGVAAGGGTGHRLAAGERDIATLLGDPHATKRGSRGQRGSSR